MDEHLGPGVDRMDESVRKKGHIARKKERKIKKLLTRSLGLPQPGILLVYVGAHGSTVSEAKLAGSTYPVELHTT